jgi:chloramphenicol 3-O-phosphotransferase
VWSVAEEQLRERTSVVLDGVAREGEVAETRQLAVRCGAAAVVVGLTCSDTTVLRRRVDGRERRIPGWHELTWEEVARVHSQWLVSDSIDLAVDTADRPEVDELARTVVALLDR